jgi:hypothetical protein
MKENYNNAEYGVWVAHGEDPNCDFGGYHHNPILGYYEGKYIDVLEYCRNLKGWSTWGSGGYLEKYIAPTIIKINDKSLKRKQELLTEKEKLEQRIKEINESI